MKTILLSIGWFILWIASGYFVESLPFFKRNLLAVMFIGAILGMLCPTLRGW
jgi:uncharacterized membrane protein YGL010W